MGRYRIAMVAACPFPANHGSAASIREMSEALVKRGHEVHVVSYPLAQKEIPVHNGIHIHRVLPHWNQNGIKVGPSRDKLLFDAHMVPRLCQVIRAEKIDIIHAHNYEGALAGYMAKLLTGRPLLYNAVNTMIDELPGYNFIRPKWLAVGLARFLDNLVPRMGSFNTVVSNELYEYLLGQGISSKRMTVLPAGVYDEMFADGDPQNVRRRYNLEAAKIILYTGNLEPFQRPDYLFKAMQVVARAMPEAHLLVMASLVKDLKPHQEMVEQLDISSRVTFCPNLPFSELSDFLAAADVTVVPRPDTPGFPVKLLNYMSAGKPTVTFEGSAKGVGHLYNVLVVPDHDWQALGEGMVKLLKDPDLCAQLGQNAARTIKLSFHWDYLAEIIEQIYDCILGQRKDYRLVHPMEYELRHKLGQSVIFYDRRSQSPTRRSVERRNHERRIVQQPISFPNRRRLIEAVTA
jgi:1,2-diacylglycerol 3-alpha-glucosyltransferase